MEQENQIKPIAYHNVTMNAHTNKHMDLHRNKNGKCKLWLAKITRNKLYAIAQICNQPEANDDQIQ